MRERFFDWLAKNSANRPWLFLLAAFVVFLVGAGLATTLVPKLTWMDLLPQDEPMVTEYAQIMEDYGSTEIILVSLEGPDPDELLRFAEEYEASLMAMTAPDGEHLFKRVVYGNELEFMLEHGLMLVEADDLDQMLDNGLLDEPGIASVVAGYNRMFKAEYVDDDGEEESPEAQERGAVGAIDSMWALPRALRWHLEHPDASEEVRRAEIEEAALHFAAGEQHFLSDDKSMLLVMVQPIYTLEEWNYTLPAIQRMRDVFEAQLLDYPAIGDNYAGPWEVTALWEMFAPYYEDDPAGLDTLRLQVPYKQPAIAPLDKLDSGTGLTGFQVLIDDETMTVYHDFGWNTVLAFLAVLVLFVVTFRMWSSPVVAMVVLAMSIVVAFGLTAITLGELTMMAMMFPVILLGLGVDYFVHILGEFTQRRAGGESIHEALRQTLQRTGKGVLTGGLTTAMAFLALGLTSFRGFTDFGVSAGVGVLATLLTSFMVLPPALVVIHRSQERWAAWRGRAPRPKAVIQFRFLEVTGKLSHRFWPITLVVVAALTAFLGFEATKVGWAKDLFDVEAENLASLELFDVLEERFHMHPDSVVTSAASLEEAWALTDALDDLGTVSMVDSISYLLPPPAEQEERSERVEQIRERIEAWGEAPRFTVDAEALEAGEDEGPVPTSAERVDAFLKALYQMDCNVITIRKSAYMAGQDRLYDAANLIVKEGESCVLREPGKPRPEGGWPRVAASEDVKAIAAFAAAHPDQMPALLDAFQDVFQPTLQRTYLGMANPEQITTETLPEDVLERYQSIDGTEYLITAYSSGDMWNEDFQVRLLADLHEVSEHVTGTMPLFVATIDRAGEEGRAAVILSLLAITLLLLADFWGLRKGAAVKGIVSSVLALIPLTIGTVWTVGCMTLLDIDLNMANVIAIPLILGIGIDNGVHVIHRYRIEGPGKIGVVMGTVGRAILLTSLTTIAAFGTFAFGLWRGMASMGIILAIGISICFLLSAYLLPALFGALEKLGIEL